MMATGDDGPAAMVDVDYRWLWSVMTTDDDDRRRTSMMTIDGDDR